MLPSYMPTGPHGRLPMPTIQEMQSSSWRLLAADASCTVEERPGSSCAMVQALSDCTKHKHKLSLLVHGLPHVCGDADLGVILFRVFPPGASPSGNEKKDHSIYGACIYEGAGLAQSNPTP